LAKRFQRKSCFRNQTIKKQELSMTAMFVNGSKQNEIAHFVLIHLQTWLPQAILVLDWSISKIFFSETALPK
jgi:hypothetical protein